MSQLKTMSTSSTSMPRAATSVETKTAICPWRKRFMTSSRRFWGMSPWMHSALTPRICKNLQMRSVLPLVLQKAMQRSKPVSRRIFVMASAFSLLATSMRNCLMSGLFCSSARTVISSASRW